MSSLVRLDRAREPIQQVDVLSGSTVRFGHRGDGKVLRKYVPFSDKFEVAAGQELSHLSARVLLDPLAEHQSALTIKQRDTLPAQSELAKLDHFARYRGTIVADSESFTLLGRRGEHFLICRDSRGQEAIIDTREKRIGFGTVDVPFSARAQDHFVYQLDHADGSGVVLLEADLPARARATYSLVVGGYATVDGQNQVRVRAYPELEIENPTDRDLIGVNVELVLNDEVEDESFDKRRPEGAMSYPIPTHDVEPVKQGQASGIVTIPIARDMNLGARATKMINFAESADSFESFTLTQKIDLAVRLQPTGGSVVTQLKVNPSNTFAFPKAEKARPAAQYVLFEGQDRVAQLRTGQYTEVGDELTLAARKPLRSASADVELKSSEVPVEATEWADRPSGSSFYRSQERKATYAYEAKVKLCNTGDHDRFIRAVFDPSDFGEGVVLQSVKVDGVDVEPVIEATTKNIIVTVAVPKKSAHEPVVELKALATRREARNLAIEPARG